jgi:hypothetical protein
MEDKKLPVHHQAKLALLKDLRKMAMHMISEGSGDSEVPGHMEKVMVAAKDKEGLAKGLDKAKEIVGQDAGGSMSRMDGVEGANDEMASEGAEEGSPEEEASESHEEAQAEGDEDHPEVAKAKEHLKALLAKHKK